VVARIRVGDVPQQLALGADGLWVAGEHSLHRIDPSTNRVVATIPLGGAAPLGDVALAPDAAWVPGEASATLWRVDRIDNRVAGTTRVGRRLLGPVDVAAWDGAVWVVCCALEHGDRPRGTLFRIDPRRSRVVRRIPIAEGPLAVAADADGVWVATASGALLRVDPVSGRVAARVPATAAGSRLQAIAPTAEGIWLADTGGQAVLRWDRASGRIGLSVPAPMPRGVAAGDGGVWAIVGRDRRLSRVDERRGLLGDPLPSAYAREVRGILVGAGALWATTGEEVVRIDPHRLPA
jgi:DNA-binding beta-propeller fold protein YncE